MTVSDSTFSANGGANPDGGAIYNEGTLTLTSSTLSGNGGVNAYGGAVRNNGVLTVEQSTFSGNTAALGGAIYNPGTLLVSSSTISLNVAVGGDGGGIDNVAGTVIARNTILAGNGALNSPDFFGSLTSLGHNLIGDTSGGDGFVASDLLNVNPLLDSLQDNGGPTETMALLPGSPAVDAGDNTDAPDFDQRGPGFPRIVGGTIDIGAFEVQPGPATHFGITAPAQVTSNTPFDVTVTALDAYGHTAAGYQGTVTFSSSDPDPQVMLPAAYTFMASDAGVHTFPAEVSLVTPGNQTLALTDTSGLMGTASILVTAPVPPPRGGGAQGVGENNARVPLVEESSTTTAATASPDGAGPLEWVGAEGQDQLPGISYRRDCIVNRDAMLTPARLAAEDALFPRREELVDEVFAVEWARVLAHAQEVSAV
jgi:predicted outer membrane repeat protein